MVKFVPLFKRLVVGSDDSSPYFYDWSLKKGLGKVFEYGVLPALISLLLGLLYFCFPQSIGVETLGYLKSFLSYKLFELYGLLALLATVIAFGSKPYGLMFKACRFMATKLAMALFAFFSVCTGTLIGLVIPLLLESQGHLVITLVGTLAMVWSIVGLLWTVSAIGFSMTDKLDEIVFSLAWRRIYAVIAGSILIFQLWRLLQA